MEDDGIDYIHPREIAECLASRHKWVPIIEGNETVGLACQICGKRVREDMERSFVIVTAKGMIDCRHAPSRKDPRF